MQKLTKAKKDIEELSNSVERQDELKRDMETSLYGIIEQHKNRAKELEAAMDAQQKMEDVDKKSIQDTVAVQDTQTLQAEIEVERAKLTGKDDEIAALREKLTQVEKGQAEALGQADTAQKALEKSLRSSMADLQRQIDAKETAITALKTSLESEHEDAQLHKNLFSDSQKELRMWQERFKESERTNKESVSQVAALTEKLQTAEKQQAASGETRDKELAELRERTAAAETAKEAADKRLEEQGQVVNTMQIAMGAVEKFSGAVGNLELSLSCLSCMEIMKQPTALLPCGHTVCAACVHETCSDCKQPVTGSVPLPAIATAISKLSFLQQNVQFLAKLRK